MSISKNVFSDMKKVLQQRYFQFQLIFNFTFIINNFHINAAFAAERFLAKRDHLFRYSIFIYS